MDWPYPEEFIKEFIGLYETMPSLWNQGSDEYRDFETKSRDFAVLLEKFHEVEPEATKPYLLKKLNVWRRQYREEKRKSREKGRPMRKRFEPFSFLPDPPLNKKKKKDPLDIDSTSENEEFLFSPIDHTEDVKPIVSQAEVQDVSSEIHLEQHIGFDRFDHVTKAWTASLESMPRHQQIIAERIINNILFEAQVGNLTTRSPIEVSQLFYREW